MVGLRCVAQPILWEPKCLRFQSTSKQCIFRAKGMEATLSIQYNYMYNIYIYITETPMQPGIRKFHDLASIQVLWSPSSNVSRGTCDLSTYQQNKHSSMVFHGPMTYHKGWPIIRDDFPWPPWPFDDPWSCPRMISSRCSASCLGTWKKTQMRESPWSTSCRRPDQPMVFQNHRPHTDKSSGW